MSKITITKTAGYVKNNPETKTSKYLFNYVVTGGDVKQYIADKTAEILANGKPALSLQNNELGNTLPEHVGLPRFISNTFLGEVVEIDRVKKKDGTFGWFADNTEQLIENSLIDALPAYAKVEAGKQLVINAIAQAKLIASEMRATKARIAEGKPEVKDLKKA